jgi:AraC family transcriptional regulator
MAISTGNDRLRALIDVLFASVDDPARGDELARRAYLSRFHFDRLVAAALGESPATFRRRLLLERAAHQLSGGTSVTEVGFEAGYSSPEAFARAFRRAFGVSPSAFAGDFRIAAPNGIHFHPPGGLLLPGDYSRRQPMDLTDRMVEHDSWLTARLIEAAAEVDEEALDTPVELTPSTPAFAEAAPSIRAMLDRLVFTKEMWSAAIAGKEFQRDEDTSLGGLKRRLDHAGEDFARLVRDIRNRGAWDTAFVDATCDPPESFTFGGAISHALSWDAYRRLIVAAALRDHGAKDISPDPLDWERARA